MHDSNRYRADEVLHYWFGEIGDDGNVTEDRSALWWRKSPETDAAIRERYEPLVQAVARGEYDRWGESGSGRLALIIALDQFPRNIYRDMPQAFAYDAQARALTRAGLERRQDRELPLVQRVFFYLPLEHAEDRDLQAESVRLFAQLRDEAPEHLHETFANYLEYAVRHQEIVDRFGRFPHRNGVLGRKSTEEEVAFLKEPGSSF